MVPPSKILKKVIGWENLQISPKKADLFHGLSPAVNKFFAGNFGFPSGVALMNAPTHGSIPKGCNSQAFKSRL
jgi:hypothetical protein